MTRIPTRAWLLASSLLTGGAAAAGGCGTATPGPPVDAASDAGEIDGGVGAIDATPADAFEGSDAACGATVNAWPLEPAVHVNVGESIVWSTNPPSSGSHFPVWARWDRVQEKIVPRGYWVHNLEHGGVILLYRCAEECPEVEAALAAVLEGLPDDPLCKAPIRHRAFVTQDPLLPDGVEVAASAWGFTYRASCVDAESLAAFAIDHAGQGPENLCNDGNWP